MIRSSSFRLLSAVLLLGAVACSDSSNTEPSEAFSGSTGFRLLGISDASDVSPDGSTVLLEDRAVQIGDVYFYDLASGLMSKQTNGGGYQGFAWTISDTKRIAGNHASPENIVTAAVWDQAGGWQLATSSYPSGCDIFLGGAWGISADGQTFVGMDWNGCSPVAMAWTVSGSTIVAHPLEVMGAPFTDNPNPPSNRASAISANGLVAGGFAQNGNVDRWPTIWNVTTGAGTMLSSGLPADCPGEVLSVSADGSMVGGTWCSDGFYWTEALGVQTIGHLDGSTSEFTRTFVNAIAANGQLLFGGENYSTAFVWTAATGMRSLLDVAKAAGADIPDGVTLTNVRGASEDGTVVAGTAIMANGGQRAFVLKLPVSAYGI